MSDFKLTAPFSLSGDQGSEELGMLPAQFATYKKFLRSTYGLILVTGPTGSGKSTSLYSTLKTLANPQVVADRKSVV